MLKVKTKLQKSEVHGLGLFADQYIPAGTVTWEYDALYDPSFTQEEIDRLPQIAKEFMLYYCYFDSGLGKYVLCSDNQKYINHSVSKENVLSTPSRDVAKRDINIGEEMLCDYNKFDPTYFKKMGITPID